MRCYFVTAMPLAPTLGILRLDTAFPRVRGDIGCADTFAFPVRYAVVAGASVDGVVHRPSEALLPAFVAGGATLAAEGCAGIATTCGFLARWQRALADRLPVPVMTSALLLVPAIARTLPKGRRVGIVTYSAADLTPEVLAGAGADPATPVAGVDPHGAFAQTIREDRATLDAAAMAADTVAAGRALLAAHERIGAVVLECANMPPYRDDVARALRLPVYDAAQAFAWFHAGL